jgi:hypothetical protein
MSSKMLDAYVRQISALQDEGRWGDASLMATGLPHLGVALSNPQMVSSRDDYLRWCQQWVRPAQDEARYSSWFEKSTRDPLRFVNGKPTALLGELRLARRLRTEPAYSPRTTPRDETTREIAQETVFLVTAFQTWQNVDGRVDATVAMNLAKLGVLR